MEDIENRLDYYQVLETKVECWGCHGYECLVCGKKISASSRKSRSYMDTSSHSRGLTANSRGAMTNHLKSHMRKGEI